MLWIYMGMVVFPMLWTVFASFKTSPEIFNDPWGAPAAMQWQNYINAWTKMNAGTYIVNSVIVSAGSLFLIMALGSMIAYVLARYEFPGNRFIFFFFVGGMMIPGFLAYIPAWFLHRSLGLLDSYWSLIIQYTAFGLPFTVFMLQSFFKTLPKELEEAAVVDGASLFTVFWKIMLPLSKSGLLTVSVFNFLSVWNEFTWALITISSDDIKTLPLGAVNIMQQAKYATDWGAMFAGFVIILIPTFAVYILFQSKLTEGITIGALK
jgi:N-acetylglucosamine transport system permease protein